MDDWATLEEQPSYWKDAESMSIRELLRFYDRAWNALSDSDPDPNLPRSEEEFERLLYLINSKILSEWDALEDISSIRPSNDPGYMYASFSPSHELREAQERLEYLKNRAAEAPYDSTLRKSEIADLRQQAQDLEREVAMREEGERESYPERYASYMESQRAYNKEMSLWQEEREKARKTKTRKIAGNIRGKQAQEARPALQGRIWRSHGRSALELPSEERIGRTVRKRCFLGITRVCKGETHTSSTTRNGLN